MSVPVPVAELDRALADVDGGYLLTTADGRVKAVGVRPVLADGVLRVTAPGRGSLANVAANSAVTLLFPPRSSPTQLPQPGLTLLVDGTAAVDGHDVVVTPGTAVLHRPATAP